MKRLELKIWFFLILFSGSSGMYAQQVSVKAVLDSSTILIGDQVELRLEVDQPDNIHLQFPRTADTITSQIEIIERSPIDTVRLDEEQRIRMFQRLLITSFDSGAHLIPPFDFTLKYDELEEIISTNDLLLRVHTLEIDTTKGPTDIKLPYGAPVTLKEVAPYILGAILIGAVIFFLLYAIKRKQKNQPIFRKPEKPKEPAHIIALRELDRIKAEKLWQRDKVKRYYSDVSDTLRTYIENRFEIPAMEQTTDETLNAFKFRRDLINEKSFDHLKNILQLSDLVKFAKYRPLPDDNNLTIVNAYFFVDHTKKVVIATPDKGDINEEDSEGVDVVMT